MTQNSEHYSIFVPFLSQEILSWSWSPDGMHIAFLSQKDTKSDGAKGDRDSNDAKIHGKIVLSLD